MTEDFLKVNGDESLSHAERAGFSKDIIHKFLAGQLDTDVVQENNAGQDAEIDDMFS